MTAPPDTFPTAMLEISEDDATFAKLQADIAEIPDGEDTPTQAAIAWRHRDLASRMRAALDAARSAK